MVSILFTFSSINEAERVNRILHGIFDDAVSPVERGDMPANHKFVLDLPIDTGTKCTEACVIRNGREPKGIRIRFWFSEEGAASSSQIDASDSLGDIVYVSPVSFLESRYRIDRIKCDIEVRAAWIFDIALPDIDLGGDCTSVLIIRGGKHIDTDERRVGRLHRYILDSFRALYQ